MPGLGPADEAGELEPVQQAQRVQLAEPDLTGAHRPVVQAVDLFGGQDQVLIEQGEQVPVTGGQMVVEGQRIVGRCGCEHRQSPLNFDS